ncbi:MAG: DUF1552 domain-containing protein [Planctomycetes bacterium]|nr:DUF1552 domain-containing protein [Planctomycetota bacterium]
MKSWHISRRTLLHGATAGIALPWLEAMLPAQGSRRQPPLRVAFIYHPIGAEATAWKGSRGEGRDFRLSPTLSILEPVKDALLVLDGLNGRSHPPGGHMGAAAVYLSSAAPGRTDSWGAETAVTLDQVLAERLSQGTPLRSLELSCNNIGRNMHSRYVSWRAPGVPCGVETDPRDVFARMFGDPQDDFYRRSVLDVVGEDARALRLNLGSRDQRRLDEYLESVRTLERQIVAFERDAARRPAPNMARPQGVPGDLTAYLRLMGDLLVLAFQTDMTRVVTLLFGDDTNEGTYARRLVDCGIERAQFNGQVENRYLDFGHHSCTHDPRPTIPMIQAFDRWYVRQLLYVLERLRASREGDGNLLDHSIIVYGCGNNGTGWVGHGTRDVPCLLIGKGGARLRNTGRHVSFANGTSLSNLWLTLTQLAGIERRDFGVSTGALTGLG